MESTNNDVVEIDVKGLLNFLLHKFWIVIIVIIAGASATWAISKFLIEPVYTSTAKVYVINKQNESSLTLSDLQSGAQLTKDYMILVKSRPVTEQVIKTLNLTMTSDELSKLIQVNTPQDTRILSITAKHHDPAIAKQIVDTIAEVSSERMVSVMGAEKVNVMEEGNLPLLPSSPNIGRNTLLGGLIGAFLVCFIIAVVYILNDYIRTTDDIEKYLGITALGILPIEESLLESSQMKLFKKIRRKGKASLA